jgi:hypothetical protein
MSSSEKLVAEMFLQLKTLTAEVAELRAAIIGSAIRMEGWTTPKKAAAALQADGVKNARHLHRLRREDVFTESKGECRNVSRGARPTWEFHIVKCRAALQRHHRQLKG